MPTIGPPRDDARDSGPLPGNLAPQSRREAILFAALWIPALAGIASLIGLYA
jgi:hypothetical protein